MEFFRSLVSHIRGVTDVVGREVKSSNERPKSNAERHFPALLVHTCTYPTVLTMFHVEHYANLTD